LHEAEAKQAPQHEISISYHEAKNIVNKKNIDEEKEER
jgi:hypothetical protein